MPIGATINCNGCGQSVVQKYANRFCTPCFSKYKKARAPVLSRPCSACREPFVGKDNRARYCGACRARDDAKNLARKVAVAKAPKAERPTPPTIEPGKDESTPNSRLLVRCGPTERELINRASEVMGGEDWIVGAVVDAARAIIVPAMFSARRPGMVVDAAGNEKVVTRVPPKSLADLQRQRAEALARGASEAAERDRRARALSGNRDAL